MRHRSSSNKQSKQHQGHRLPIQPSDLLKKWFHYDSDIKLYGTLSMIDHQGNIKSRSTLIETLDASGNLYIAMNANSFWMDLTQSQTISLSFNSFDSDLQVNVQGIVEMTRVQDSLKNYLKQTLEVQMYSLISNPDNALSSQFEAQSRYAWKKQQFENEGIEINPNWTLYLIKPYLYEFIIESQNEIPECLMYQKIDGQWYHQYKWI